MQPINVKRRLIYIPGLIAGQFEESIFSGKEDLLGSAHTSVVFGSKGIVELALLGLNPQLYPISAGPLMIAALGLEPPFRSVQFHLSLAGLDENGVLQRPGIPSPDEMRILEELAPKLSTKVLTVLAGSQLDFGLVWESGSIDLGTTGISEAYGKTAITIMPEGDGEVMLRRLIDDSMNLLMDQDFNKKRRDDGRVPINIVWPWGQGFPAKLPNLALRYSAPISVIGSSLKSKGIANLLGAKHVELLPDGKVPESLPKHGIELVIIDSVQAARDFGRVEKVDQFWDLVRSQMIQPFLETKTKEFLPIVGLLATSNHREFGFASGWNLPTKTQEGVPFIERVLDDPPRTQKRDFEWFFEQFYQSAFVP